MKKFFQGGGGLMVEPPTPRGVISSNGDPNSLRLHQSNSSATTVFQNLPPISGAAFGSPRTPQFSTSSQQYFDIQTSGRISPAASSTMVLGSGVMAPVQSICFHPPTSPGIAMPDTNNSTTNTQAHLIERSDLYKGLKSLENLLVAFDEYRDLKNKMAKCEKKLGKNLGELSKSKMLEEVPSITLQTSALVFDSMTETTSKHTKLIQKEYEALNEHCGRYFRKIAKEEKTHDEMLDTLDSKVKKAHASHEKNVKRSGRGAIESHDKYIQTVQNLTQEISRVKVNHSSSIGSRTFVTSLVVASTLGGIADSEFKVLCENVRKSGQYIGKLNEWLNFASTEGMSKMQPVDLNEDAMGWAQVLAIKEAEIREEMMKQEQARFSQLEHTQALLKAQQMGWTPPNQQSRQQSSDSPLKSIRKITPPTTSLQGLPRLDSGGQLVEQVKTERPTMSRAVSTADSQAVQGATKESAAQDYIEEQQKEEETLHSLQSSLADGTVIDRGEPVDSMMKLKPPSPTKSSKTSSRDSSDEIPSLSTSVSKNSEDSIPSLTLDNRPTAPSTPKDEAPPRDVIIVRGGMERVESILKKPESVEEVALKVERSTDRYVDVQVNKQASSFRGPASEMQSTTMKRSDSIVERARQLSLWEHEKERERQVDREGELQKRLMEAEDRLRKMGKEGQPMSTSNGNTALSNRREEVRPRYSEPSRSYQTAIRHDEEIPAQRYEPERYAPAVGLSRLSSEGVNRTLSTDSERSFVARMKARYQQDKDKGNLSSNSRTASAIKSSSGVYPAYTTESAAAATASSSASANRGRYDSAPSRSIAENSAPHSLGCGCWSCSARHYSESKPKLVQHLTSPLAPPPRHPSSLLPPTTRRQSMPPIKDERSALIAPPTSREVYERRSFEGEPDRRVVFAHDYQTVR